MEEISEIEVCAADDGVRVEAVLLEDACCKVRRFPHLANGEDRL